MHELPLVFFTVLAQASVGLFVIMTMLTMLKKANDAQMDKAAIISLIFVMIAGGSAIMHLGQPLRALNALFGAGRSPMSNEILICAIFGACVFAYVAANGLSWVSTAMKSAISVVGSIAGLGLIFTIPQVYQLDSIPTWNTPITSIQLLLTALICGGALATSLTKQKVGCVISCVAILILLAISPYYFAFLNHAGADITGIDSWFWGAKFVLLTIGFVLLVIYSALAKSMLNPRLAYIASGLFVIAEIAGRIGFYDLWAIGM